MSDAKAKAEAQANEQGGVTDEEIREAAKEHTPAGTQEIADAVGMTRQGVEYRLKQFDQRWQNPVYSKKIGPTRIWMHYDRIWPPGWFAGDTFGPEPHE